jgi:elongation factor P
MATVGEFRRGMTLRIEGELYVVTEFQHVNPGNWRPFIRTKLKSLKSGKIIEKTFRTSDTVDEVRLETRDMQYLYNTDDIYHFMDTTTYEQIPISGDVIGEGIKYFKENLEVQVVFYEERPISVQVPTFVEVKVVETEPGVKGDTVTNVLKPAKVETGATINVPLFVNEGDIIKVDTRTDTYIERVNK